MEKFRNKKWIIRYLFLFTTTIIILISLWKIIISTSIGGFFVFILFGIYTLTSINIFNTLIMLFLVIYLSYRLYSLKTNKQIKKKRFPKLFFIFLILILPQFLHLKESYSTPRLSQGEWQYSMRTSFNRTIDLFETFNATFGYKQRKNIYLNDSRVSHGLDAQSTRVYLGLDVNEVTIENSLDTIYYFKDGMDFRLNSLLRIIYLDLNTNVLNITIKNKICDAFGKAKYWFTEPNEDNAIFWTENHQILFHTAELLIGQLFPNDTFMNSGMTGNDHIDHAKPLIKRWLDWRAQFGFSEWHSNTYYTLDIHALLNLVDFALDAEIVNKAAMVLDLIAFGFANNYYKDRYATSHGRAYDRTKVGKSESSPASRDGTSETAWIMLGIGEHNPLDGSNRAAIALATSDSYAPPPILERIANNARLDNEHKERNGIELTEGSKYNISYTQDDLMYWWSMSAPVAPQVIESTNKLIYQYNLKTDLIYGPQILSDFLKVSSFLHGLSLSEYSDKLKLITQGISLESANIYTYRTPFYQLSGVQDHQKGMNSFQEHIWQATLDNNAFVYTSSPGGLTKDFEQEYVGGWNPRATLYRNIGVIQYDRETMPLEAELLFYILNLFSGSKFYIHAYFPRWAFDEVQRFGKWTFGVKDDGYIALFSDKPTQWVSDYELRVDGFKNVWIVELGSANEYGTFNQFISNISQSKVKIIPQALGYNVEYNSPSQGLVSVTWDNPMYVKGKKIDLGPYPRFNNKYCYQDFGTKTTIIEFNNQRLELNFDNSSRIYDD